MILMSKQPGPSNLLLKLIEGDSRLWPGLQDIQWIGAIIFHVVVVMELAM